jgi:glycosyltransferase involved in cell wall biosynthesis
VRLDVIIPTHNRHLMLRRTLDSLLAGPVPVGLEVKVTVVDNNSTDSTRQTAEAYDKKFRGGLGYVFEGRQGRSFALNAGISATSGELVGMIDDDEEVDSGWYSSIQSIFSRGGVDFIGGPYVPRWGAEPPDWLPTEHLGAIGWVDGGTSLALFDKTYPGMLMGGNAVLTRAILNQVGPYNTRLGRTGSRLLSGEDDDMYQRLLAAGARGFYVPDLVIYHYVPPERLGKNYFRRWTFWRGVSAGLIDRERRMSVVYLCGMPRYLYGEALRGMCGVVASIFNRRRDPARAFNSELAVTDAVGFFYGKHLYGRLDSQQIGEPGNHNPDNGRLASRSELAQSCPRSAE